MIETILSGILILVIGYIITNELLPYMKNFYKKFKIKHKKKALIYAYGGT